MDRLCRILTFPEVIVLGDFYDPLPLFKLCDIVLSDNSGVVYEAILLGKPCIMLGCWLGGEKYEIFETREGASFAATGSFEIVKSIGRPEELRGSIREVMKKGPVIWNGVDLLFSKTDGNAGKRAAEIIMNDREYPSIPTLEKYSRALEVPRDENMKQYILKQRDSFLNRRGLSSSRKVNWMRQIVDGFCRWVS